MHKYILKTYLSTVYLENKPRPIHAGMQQLEREKIMTVYKKKNQLLSF